MKVRKIQSTSWASRNDTLIKKNYKKFKIREWQLCLLRQEDPRGSE